MITVSFFNTDANIGGAGRAAYSLLKKVQDEEVQARLYVKHSGVADEDVKAIRTGFFRSKFQDYISNRFAKRGYPDRFRLTTLELIRDPWIQRTDIFQLYNLHGGYFALSLLPYLADNRPVIWRMPDAWPITGKCAYPYDCGKWQTGCGKCPILDEYPSLKKDTTRWWFEHKYKIYRQCRITVVTPSNWLRGMVKRSPLLGECDVLTIPTGIDLQTFSKMDKEAARTALGIPCNSSVVLFSAGNLGSIRKGGRMLSSIIEMLCAKGPENLLVLLAGGGKTELPPNVAHRVQPLGRISSESDMAGIYSAADVFAFPTRADNLPKAPIESLACGTPCVASDVGGIPEIIQDNENGLLVRGEDSEAFAHSILRLLYDEELLSRISANCRNSVIGRYDIEDEASAYRRLYESLLGRFAPSQPVRVMNRFSLISNRRHVAHSLV